MNSRLISSEMSNHRWFLSSNSLVQIKHDSELSIKNTLKQGLCIYLEVWDGEGEGREFQKERDICMPMADSGWGLTENSKTL